MNRVWAQMFDMVPIDLNGQSQKDPEDVRTYGFEVHDDVAEFSDYGMKGWSQKPCPGCGRAGHPLDGVCATCRDTLDRAWKRETALVARHAAYRAYQLPTHADDLPPLGLPHDHDRPVRAALATAIVALADRPEFLGVPFPWPDDHSPHLLSTDRRYHPALPVPLTPEQAAAVRGLVPALRNALREAYNLGLQRGHNLLAQLAAGDVTMAQFEAGVTPKPPAPLERPVMSTKIYNGYRLAPMSLPELAHWLRDLRRRLAREQARLIRAQLRTLVVFFCDTGVLAPNPEAWQAELVSHAARTGETPRSLTPESFWGTSPFSYALWTCADRQEAVRETQHRDPAYDWSAEACFYVDGSALYATFYAEQPSYQTLWEAAPGVEPWPYWNNTDRPPEVSAREWAHRAAVWRRVLPGVPVEEGLHAMLVPPNGVFQPMMPERLLHPPISVRARARVAARRALQTTMPPGVTADTPLGLRAFRWLDWMGSPAGQAAVRRVAKTLAPQLPRVILPEWLQLSATELWALWHPDIPLVPEPVKRGELHAP